MNKRFRDVILALGKRGGEGERIAFSCNGQLIVRECKQNRHFARMGYTIPFIQLWYLSQSSGYKF